MATKKVSFAEKNLELVKKIEVFQKMQNLPSFVKAVRILLKKGLQVNELIRDVK